MKVKMLKRAFGHDTSKAGINLAAAWYEKGEVYELNSLGDSFLKLKVCEECSEEKKEEPKEIKAEVKQGAPENKKVSKKKASKKEK